MEEKILKIYQSVKIKNQHPIDFNSVQLICKLIDQKNLKTMLEIGTGLGYSSYFFAKHSKIQQIVTLEKKLGNFIFAKYQVNQKLITYLWVDCLKYQPIQNFDLIFIDGPKNQYQKIFEKYHPFLNLNGAIIIDNIFLKRIDSKKQLLKTSRYNKLIDKMNLFVDWLKDLNDWTIELFDLDDGLAVCQRKI